MININDEIFSWINSANQDYFTGVGLFVKISRKRTLISTLIKKESKFNREKLDYELKKYLTSINYEQETSKNSKLRERAIDIDSISQSNKPLPEEIDAKKSASGNNSGDSSSGPYISNYISVRIENLKRSRNLKYAERDSLHGQLHRCRIQPERYKVASELMGIQPEIDEFNLRISKIFETGQLDQLTVEQGMTSDEFKRLKLVESYIARQKRLIKSAKTLTARETAASKLEKYETELKSILN